MRDVAPPSGQQPPAELRLRDGRTVQLPPIAAAAADRLHARAARVRG